MDEFILPSSVLIIIGSLIAILGTQMTGKARRTTRTTATWPEQANPLGRGKAVKAGGWFLFLLGLLGLMISRLV
jgi:ABC-type Fe3+ transport system permease subunit